MSAENQFVSVLWTSPGRGTNANEAEVLQLQDRMKGRLNSFISPDNTVLPASRGPGVYTPTCRTQVTLGGGRRTQGRDHQGKALQVICKLPTTKTSMTESLLAITEQKQHAVRAEISPRRGN